jgi:small subunit ribosomal protein S18
MQTGSSRQSGPSRGRTGGPRGRTGGPRGRTGGPRGAGGRGGPGGRSQGGFRGGRGGGEGRGGDFRSRGRDNNDERGSRVFRKKVCRFKSGKILLPDYKDVELLRKFITEKGKIIPRRITGTSSKYQRQIAAIIKRSRHAGLIPFQAD